MSLEDLVKCFFAYPSRPPSLPETIETAIDSINESQVCEATGWRELPIGGRLVIHRILKEIEASDVFVADLTTLNPNVLFELGYAVARNKRIWVILNPTYPDARKNYEQMKILTTVGYREYMNYSDILNVFFEEQPYSDLENTLYGDVIEVLSSHIDSYHGLLYLKSVVNTDASSALTRRLEKSQLGVIIDDPNEVSIQTLAWYAQNVVNSHAVVSHLLDEERGTKFPFQNAKYSFVTGLAIGFGKRVLMVAHSPYQPPFDYQEFLVVHETARECVEAVDTWMPEVEESYEEKEERIVQEEKDLEAAGILQSIYLGDYIAENEEANLADYFIVTASYGEALRANRSMIYVGRKGSGKTANLLRLSQELGSDRRNHVSTIRPVEYDLEAIIEILKESRGRAEKGFLMESLWKFLIYTELSCELLDEITTRPAHTGILQQETEFLQFVEQNSDLILADFSLRLENAVGRLLEADLNKEPGSFRARVSEELHESLLADLRQYLGDLLEGKERVVILLDNLDKAWRRGADLDMLSEFLFGLLNVSNLIESEFQKHGVTWRRANLSLIVFLRGDIFSHILMAAPEADKIAYSQIDWEDVELLRRVIEERFLTSFSGGYTREDIWTRIFVEKINGIPTAEYITDKIIPRPRDMIYFCKASLSHAINRGHTCIEEEDILKAEEEYSQYAYTTLLSETRPVIANIESLVVEFAGSNEIVTRDQVAECYEEAKIDDASLQDAINILVEALFLGIETAENEFRYMQSYDKKDIYFKLAKETAKRLGSERYRINPSFQPFLEIQSQ
jgi:hypothetical protein